MPLKTNSSIREIHLLDRLLFISGLATSLGPFDYNSLIPNKSVALIYIFIGIALMLSSNFLKNRMDE